MDIIQKITLEVLERLEERPRHASEEIARAFFKSRRLFPTDRAAIVERIHSILRSTRLLDYAIDQSGPIPEIGSPRRRARWFAREVLERRLRPSEAAREMSKIDWVRVLEIPAQIARIPDPLRRLALSESLPDWLAERLVDEYGEAEAFALAHAWNEPAPLTLRANTLRVQRDDLVQTFEEYGLEVSPTERSEDGLTLHSTRNVFRSPEFQAGLFEVQDEGSQLVSELVAPPPRGTVLDACAGSGGKTLHLGAILGGRGRVVAVGVGPVGARQLEELERRAKRAGLRNVQTVRVEGADGGKPHDSEVAGAELDGALGDGAIYEDVEFAGSGRDGALADGAIYEDVEFAGSDRDGALAAGAIYEDVEVAGAGRGDALTRGDVVGMGGDKEDADDVSVVGERVAEVASFGDGDDVPAGGSDLGSVDTRTSSGSASSSSLSVPAAWPPPLAKLLGRIDRVLVDAPCSGLGVLRRNPEARDRITPETVTRLATLQRDILERFAPFVKPGGRLVYATCSVLREENDAVVDAFLQAHPEFQLMPAKEILGKARALEIGDGDRLRLLPHRHGTDGFFAVVLRKTKG